MLPPPPGPLRAELDRLARDSWPTLVLVAERALATSQREAALTAGDLVQRVFLRVLSGRALLLNRDLPCDRQVQRLAQAVRYEAMHAGRDDARHRELAHAAVECAPLPPPPPRADQVASYRELRELVAATGSLTPAERQVALLVLLEDWTVAEVAEKQSKSPHTVRELLRRGRRKLRPIVAGAGWSRSQRSRRRACQGR